MDVFNKKLIALTQKSFNISKNTSKDSYGNIKLNRSKKRKLKTLNRQLSNLKRKAKKHNVKLYI